ncbi:MocR-like transcription factor YczR [Herbiconiux sp. SYSU D00978]|uniref:MocR-like transcription factor YczR n=1 Tax=Herbiconiux sp. SYSU D00978 TaxID=2812562 RepID=UPI001A96F751|nr:PLP-dependent aminotransferase family protein [Herbiconiux sp. SYSU D00978]
MSTLSARQTGLLLSGWRDAASAAAYLALADRLRLLIIDGRIPVGTRLPAERELATQLAVSRTTVTAAYGALREGGWLTSVRGSGSVARLPQRAPILTESPSTGVLDFTKAAMPATPALAAAAQRAAARLPEYLGDPGFDRVGLPELRAQIADRYTQRGLPTDPDEVLVTIGAQHAITLLLRTLVSRGDRALVETPSYPHAYEALKLAGTRMVPVSVSDDGWDLPALEQSLQRTSPAIAYLMPDFHNPTGQVMPAAVRAHLLDLASRQGTVVIADETMAEMNIDHPALPLPLAAYGDAVLIGSVGKSVWGGVRVGWIRAGRPLIQRIANGRTAVDLGTPTLEQLIVSELLPQMDDILRERGDVLRAGRDHLTARLARSFPEWEVPDVSGGLTFWINLGEAVSSQLTLAARAEGLLLAAGPKFGIDGAFERFLRLPFSYPTAELDRAVDALETAWRRVGHVVLPEDQGLLAAVV